MPTVIDSLVLELGIDPKKFLGGEKDIRASLKRMIEDGRKGGVETESQAKHIGEAITGVKRMALGLTTALLSGMGVKQFLGYITSLDANTGRFARTLGMSTQELGAWQGAVKSVGGSAEGATAALSGMSVEVDRFLLTGQAAFLPLLNHLSINLKKQNGELKTSAELFLEIADAIKASENPRRAFALLGMIPGMNQDMVNLLMLGRAGVQSRLDKARANTPTKEQTELAQKFQEQSAQLEQSATNLGRAFSTSVIPTLIKVMDGLTNLFTKASTPQGLSRVKPGERNYEAGTFGGWFEDMINQRVFGHPAPAPSGKLHAIPRSPLLPAVKGDRQAPGPTWTVSEMEAYIKTAAASRGIDPGLALAYARSQSGGMATGAAADFEKSTGLNVSDPSTAKAQIDYILDRAKAEGGARWGGWRGRRMGGGSLPTGASGAAAAGDRGASGSTSTSTSEITIGTVQVVTQATDADGIARDIVPALRRQGMAAPANTGQE